MKRIYYIENMSCPNCKNIIRNTLTGLRGIEKVSVSLPRKEVTVEAGFDAISDDEIIAAVGRHMYNAERR